ncbi:protein IQ-DOMAIN 3-like [Typha latifolia]|uniref:protein IQ-DOMAIN 3-like n=1 Tax=Typha latifolia TaxID=4733 RepID=UPI003C2E3648
MGKKGKWFGAVKKVFSPESKEKKDQKSKKKGPKHSDAGPSELLENAVPDPGPPSLPHPEEVELVEAENERSKHAYSVAQATAAAAEAAVASAQAAAEVFRLTTSTNFSGKSREEIAAIKIQTAFRGYLARRALQALRGLVRLKSLICGDSVKRQATSTLHCMQTVARIQSQIRARRLRMSEESQALQRQLLLKNEKELDSMGDDWDDSLQSREKIEASLVSRQEAAIRRERAMAYAFSHQWKSSSRSVNPMFIDPNNQQWGWSWLDRWMAARPCETQSTIDKEVNNDRSSTKNMTQNAGEGEITRAYARRDVKPDQPSKTTPKPTHLASKPTTPSPKPTTSTTGRSKSTTLKNGCAPGDDDARSVVSVQSERPRRHSMPGSSIRNDESQLSSSAVRSFMAPTESAKAKSRFQSPWNEEVETPEKGGSIGSVKKRLSFPAGDNPNMATPVGTRRHSGPPKVEIAVNDVEVHVELYASNGESR